MAAKNVETEVIYETLLPSGRAFRFVKLDSKRLLEVTERATESLPPNKQQNAMAVAIAVQKETVATCARGVTHSVVELKTRPPTPAELAAHQALVAVAKTAGKEPPPAPTEVPDLEATLKPLREKPKAWRELGYASLVIEGPTNMFKVFDDPADWKAVQDRISQAQGSLLRDPFKGMLTSTH